MEVRELIRALGGPGEVGRAVGCTGSAVSHWGRLGVVPPEHHLTLWRLALQKGVGWEPPKADAIRHLLAVAPAPQPSPKAA